MTLLAINIGSLSGWAQETIVPAGSNWRWRKGDNEVSNPNTLWRALGFSDTSWPASNAPFHYGESFSGGTLLGDMRSNYTCVFLRTTFVVTNVQEISLAQFVVNYDDGFVAWINGTEVARAGVTSCRGRWRSVDRGRRYCGRVAPLLPVGGAAVAEFAERATVFDPPLSLIVLRQIGHLPESRERV